MYGGVRASEYTAAVLPAAAAVPPPRGALAHGTGRRVPQIKSPDARTGLPARSVIEWFHGLYNADKCMSLYSVSVDVRTTSQQGFAKGVLRFVSCFGVCLWVGGFIRQGQRCRVRFPPENGPCWPFVGGVG